MKTLKQNLLYLFCVFLVVLIIPSYIHSGNRTGERFHTGKLMYWFMLYRKSNVEVLYFGIPLDNVSSRLLNVSQVKSGIPFKRPTPLPQFLGKQYWTLTDKYNTWDNPETAPFFLSLDVPVSEEYPYGPAPYEECFGQCNWEVPGEFGLHGVNGNISKLAPDNSGSSGCIRHHDRDISYLYNLLDPKNEEIRYYIQDV